MALPPARKFGCWSLLFLTAVACQTSAMSDNPSNSRLSALVRVLDRGEWTRNDIAYVGRLLQRGESIHTRTPRGVNVLMFAVRTANPSLVRQALKAGIDVNARTGDGRTALMDAMRSRNAQSVHLLLKAGADVNAQENRYGRTALMEAAHFKFREGVVLLLDHSADIRARNKNGATVLAYTDGHPGLIRLLQQHGAKP